MLVHKKQRFTIHHSSIIQILVLMLMKVVTGLSAAFDTICHEVLLNRREM